MKTLVAYLAAISVFYSGGVESVSHNIESIIQSTDLYFEFKDNKYFMYFVDAIPGLTWIPINDTEGVVRVLNEMSSLLASQQDVLQNCLANRSESVANAMRIKWMLNECTHMSKFNLDIIIQQYNYLNQSVSSSTNEPLSISLSIKKVFNDLTWMGLIYSGSTSALFYANKAWFAVYKLPIVNPIFHYLGHLGPINFVISTIASHKLVIVGLCLGALGGMASGDLSNVVNAIAVLN